ncbi:MAG: TraR/DksA C4-type zinc finger protein [Desulfobacter sp.]|nr:TraR/DksA C4-type zinc finger protein [Desulfobacter sp.]WDP84791.1 MAG: TraR/DksA C4-type zinc finger protein [Desulfobacter sp.]
MGCAVDTNLIEATISFHGHSCPGLAIGIRAAELAMEKLEIQKTANSLCVTETDMCGVDAIQFLTGCSFGKGNLVHKDFGKSAFTFFNRDTSQGFRALFLDNGPQQEDRTARIRQIMAADLEDIFEVQKIDAPPVRPARILKSIVCDKCKEMTMESRIRLFGGEQLCMPCFKAVEQKI